MTEIKKNVSNWLNAESEFYSWIMKEPTKRRTALLVNLITIFIMIAVIAVEGSLTVSFVAMLCAGYLVFRLNKDDKE